MSRKLATQLAVLTVVIFGMTAVMFSFFSRRPAATPASAAPADSSGVAGVTVFTIGINGVDYTSSRSIRPTIPIEAIALHPNPNVTQVRMQHPDSPALFRTFAIGRPFRISNHEGHMRAGHESTSEFIALDAKGNELDRFALTFRP